MRAFNAWFCRTWLHRPDRRGTVTLLVAVSLIPVLLAVGAALDLSRISAGRAALQQAVDNAALSGAAAYVIYTDGDPYNWVARTVATSAFCNAVTSLPAGVTLAAGSFTCAGTAGPSVSAAIGGHTIGTRGITPSSGCSSENTVVTGVTCGFIVTVAATATMPTTFASMIGQNVTISVTASALNPFINLGTALAATFNGNASYADSLWVYPLLLDANGEPDFATNAGALPDTSACTGAPTQTSCGNYAMLASTMYASCTAGNPCNVGGAVFGGDGAVENPRFGNVVITATTPLGFALESTAGAPNSYGYSATTAPDGCKWAYSTVYATISQVYDVANNPLLVDSNGHWTLPTHWFYSSYLKNGRPPSQSEIDQQENLATNPATGQPYAYQDNPPVPNSSSGVDTPATCANSSAPQNHQYFPTTYPTSGNTNCSMYIVKDPVSLAPDPSLKVIFGQTPNCFSPANTPGAQYAALSCQSFKGHSFLFLWNDMGGKTYDDSDYGNGSMLVTCSGSTNVTLIN